MLLQAKEIGAGRAVTDKEEVQAGQRLKEFRSAQNLIEAMRIAKRSSPQHDLFAGKIERFQKLFVRRTGRKFCGIDAVGEEEEFFFRDVFFFAKNLNDPLGYVVHVGRTAVAPLLDPAKAPDHQAFLQEAAIDYDVRP